MKTKIYFLILLFTIFGLNLFPDNVDLETAKTLAKNAFYEKVASYLSLAYKDIVVEEETVIYNNDVPLIYIFNVNTNKGFIIISAQDNVYPVLGFSYEGAYDSESFDIPPAFTGWMEHYKEQIIYATENSIASSPEIQSEWIHFSEKIFSPSFPKGGVAPLVTTKWGQGNPYHAKTPQHPDADEGYKGERHCPTGCTATAMAQVLKYWSYSPGYAWNTIATTYAPIINPGAPDPPGCIELATLMKNVGTSIGMVYEPAGSAAGFDLIPKALKDVFGMANTGVYQKMKDFKEDFWKKKLCDDLDVFMPIIYEGYGTAGHAWVCDGYMDNFFHFNMGWDSRSDGYYLLNCIATPDPQHNFSFNQGAVFGIKPSNADPFIKIIFPNGGENFLAGTNNQIKWVSNIEATKKFIIKLFRPGEEQLLSPPVGVLNNGIFSWEVIAALGTPPNFTNDYKIRIIWSDPVPQKIDESDQVFKIDNIASIKVNLPTAGMEWIKGYKYSIQWTSNFGINEKVKIELIHPTNPIYNIPQPPADILNTGSYEWTIPAVGSDPPADPNLNYRIKIYRVNDLTLNNTSDAFKILNPVQINLTSPNNGNEKWARGTIHKINWTCAVPGTVKIELLKNDIPFTPPRIIAENYPISLQYFDWTIPNDLQPGNDYKIKIVSSTSSDVSDANFSITRLELTSPNGMELWGKNTIHKIKWHSDIGGHVKIELNGAVITGMGNLINDGAEDWTITQDVGVDKKIKITSIEDNNVFDESDGNFTISNVEVISPNGGEVWAKGKQHEIKWIASFPEKVDIILWHQKPDNSWENWAIASDINNNNGSITSFAWDTDKPISKKYIIRVQKHSDPNIYNDSNWFFEINNIEVITPNGGEEWVAGNDYNITWSDDITENVKITLLKGGVVYRVLFASTSSDGSETWHVPPPPDGDIPEPGSDYRICLESIDNSTLRDESDNNFTIISTKITNPQGLQQYQPGGSLNLKWISNQTGTVEITIMDWLANTVLNLLNHPNNLLPQENLYEWNIPNLPPGIYTVIIRCSDHPELYDKRTFEIIPPSPCTAGLWTGAYGDGDWFNGANWDCGVVPDPGADITIPAVTKAAPPVIIGGPVIVGALTILPAGQLSLGCQVGGPCGELTVNGSFNNNGIFNMFTEGGNGYSSSLITNGVIAGGGVFNYTRDMFCTGTSAGAADPNWHYLAAPIDGFTTHSMLDYYVNAWDQPTGRWVNVAGTTNPPCIPGPNVPLGAMDAWSINYANDYVCGATNPGTGLNLEFSGGAGSVHTGPYAKPFGYGAIGYQMWNMMANPYPSGLDMSLVTWHPNMVQGAAYWDGCFGNYVYWTPAVGTYVMSPGLGFFTEATAPGVFALSGAERAHGADWFWKSEVSNLLTLKATGNNRSDLTHIRFMDYASPAFEKTGDFHKLFVDGAPMIYTNAGADQLAVNALPETESVPMGFVANGSGDYTLEATETSDFSQVYLEDKVTGAVTDLLTDSYSFNYQDGDNPDRFVIHFKDVPVSNGEEPGISVFSAQNNVIVGNSNNQEGNVAIYNLVGQCIKAVELENGTNTIVLENTNGIYIVKVNTASGVVNRKVYIQ